MPKTRPAFTLIELIVVLGILALLLVLVTPRVAGYVQTASETTAKANARAIMDASELYLLETSTKSGTPAPSLSSATNPDILAPYLKLSKEDTYTLTYTETEGSPSYTGSYTRGDLTVTIPGLDLQGQAEEDPPTP